MIAVGLHRDQNFAMNKLQKLMCWKEKYRNQNASKQYKYLDENGKFCA
jgi:hypothetical protein